MALEGEQLILILRKQHYCLQIRTDTDSKHETFIESNDQIEITIHLAILKNTVARSELIL